MARTKVTPKPAAATPGVTKEQEFQDLYMEIYLDWSKLREAHETLGVRYDQLEERYNELARTKQMLDWSVRRIQSDLAKIMGDFDGN
jgi:hypothetical protein